MDCSMQSVGKPCPSASPEVCSNSCPLSWWFFLTILSPWFPLWLIGLISMLFKGLVRVFSWEASQFESVSSFFSVQPSLWSNSHICTWLLEKNHIFVRTFVGKVMFLLFNTQNMSRFTIAFLQRNKHLLISWLQSSSSVIWEPGKRNCHCFHFSPFCLPWSDGTGCHDLICFLNVEFQANFFTLSYQETL